MIEQNNYQEDKDTRYFDSDIVLYSYQYPPYFIKARCLDEIMEFLNKVSIEDKFSLQNAYILEAIEDLTKIKLFK